MLAWSRLWITRVAAARIRAFVALDMLIPFSLVEEDYVPRVAAPC